MEDKIREHIEGLFVNAPNTAQAMELKEEIFQNTVEHYRDLTLEGKSEEAAYNIAISRIGDIDELINMLHRPEPAQIYSDYEKADRLNLISSALISVGVMLYVGCLVPVIFFHNLRGLALTLIIAAVATAIVTFAGMIRKPKYIKQEETMVEDFKAWKATRKRMDDLHRSINGALLFICLSAYFLLSFLTGAWHITWVIFLIWPAIRHIINAFFDLKE